MAYTTTQLNSLFKLWSVRGPALSGLTTGLLQFMSQSPYDVSAVVGPALLIAQSFASAQARVLDFIMNDSSFVGWSLDLQGQIAQLALNWQDLFVLLSNIAVNQSLPRLDTLYQATPASRYYGAVVQSNAASIDIALESFLNVPTLAGITIATFWQASSLGLQTLARLDTLDWAISDGNLTLYYGSNATTDDLIADALDALNWVNPLQPDITLLLSMVSNVSPAGYSTDTVVSITAVPVPQGEDIESIAYQYLGDADEWVALAEFNGLGWPYISDDPIDQLGRPEVEGMVLAADLAAGAIELTLSNTNFPAYNDQRLLLQQGADYQIVTITDASAYPILKFAPALDEAFTAQATSINSYAPVYDSGVVLHTGSTILIPSTLANAVSGVLTTASSDIQRFGIDLALTEDGSLIANEGDFALVKGDTNLLQAIGNRFDVKQGQLIHLPAYGTGIDRFIRLKNTSYYAIAAVTDAIQTVLQDPRTPQAVNPQASIEGDQLLLDFSVSASNQRLLLPVSLSLPSPA